MSSRGVVYLLQGMGIAERLAVSLWSLRKHYSGDVTVLVGGLKEQTLVRSMSRDFKCNSLLFDPVALDVRNAPLLTKTLIPRLTPFDDTVFLDADTLITGSIDELFGHDLTLTQYSYRTTHCKLPKKWIRSWLGVDAEIDELVHKQIEVERPFINSGIFAFLKGNPQLDRWRLITFRNRRGWGIDQTAMQLLTSELNHRVLDERFNRCPKWGRAFDDVRIWHFHGRCHCSSKVNCSTVWVPAFMEAMRESAGGLSTWAGRYDASVLKVLGDNS